MRPRTTLILVVLAVSVLGGGWYFGPHQNPVEQEQASVGTALFPGLGSTLDKAGKIEIAHAGKHFVILRKGDIWTLPSLGFYPVEASKVHAMLAGLAELRVLGKRTADPAEFAALGVDDPNKSAATGTLVAVSDGAGHPLASLIVGHQRYATSGSETETLYVRRPGADQSWLAQGKLSVDATPDLWIDHSIANIDHSKIVHVAIARGPETLVFAPKDGKLALLDPTRHPALEPYKLDSVWRALEYLSFSSVRAGPALPGKPLARAVFTIAGGTAIHVTLARDGKDLWARFAADGTDAEAKALARKFGDWSYRLGDWRESALAPTLDDLLAKQPPAAAKPGSN
jgi:Domain of unknown function (DUF4340)